MKNNFRKTTFLIFCGVLVILLFSCKNPFLTNADGKYQVSFETNCETKIESYRTDKIESIQELSKAEYKFGGWYTNVSFEGDAIRLPYEVKGDITLYAKWIEIPTVTFVTNCDTKMDSYRTDKIESIQELTKEGFEFDGWYTSKSFEDTPISFPYIVTQPITLYAKWIDKTNIKTFGFSEIKDSSDYVNGVLTINHTYEKVIFQGNASETFSDLCIKISKPNKKIVFDNFSFTSSRTSPLIESASDIAIEYKGNNKLSSSASGAVCLIKSLGTIEIRGNDKSTFELQTNTVTKSDVFAGSIGIEANKVIINSGIFAINGSNGWNNNTNGRNGGNGSSGIKAFETVIKNNAIVNITAGNGGCGNNGIDYKENRRQEAAKFQNGYDGYPGGDGGNGGHGGIAIDGNLEVITGTITLQGGKGGDGGHGGTGGDGGKGGYTNAMWKAPGNGGNGGDGGKAGKGGNGGDAINGYLRNPNLSDVNLVAGKCGKNGIPGEGGKGGITGSKVNFGIGNFDECYPGSPGARGDSPDNPPPHDGVEHR